MNGARDFENLDFTGHCRARYGASGKPLDFYKFAYRFGYDIACNPEYDADDVWLVIEMKARREWVRKYPSYQWIEFRDAVRFGWQSTKSALAKPF